MAVRHGKWEGRIIVPSGGWSDTGNFTLTESTGGGAQDITVTAGEYYWSSVGDGANDFAAQLKADLESASANTLTYTVTIAAGEDGTGKLTIAVSSGTYDIAWGSADGQTVRDLCGFAADISAQSTATGSNQARMLWLPDCPHRPEYHNDSDGTPIFSGFVGLGPDGSYSSVTGSKHTRNSITYEAVTQAKTIVAAEGSTNESYEKWWLDVVGGEFEEAVPGSRVRWYPDAGVDGTFKTYNFLNVNQPNYARKDADWDGLWTIRMELALN